MSPDAAAPGLDAVIIAPMDVEARPFLNGASEPVDLGVGKAHRVTIGHRSALVVQTGIGLVNSAVGATLALARFHPTVLLCSGTAGGLAEGIFIGDVVVGIGYGYFDADATAFGYQIGQIPGMPADYPASPNLRKSAQTVRISEQRIRTGRIISGDSFVAAHNVHQVREEFPGALAADMESAGLAQVAYLFGVPFLAVRGISDLCGPTAGADHALSGDEVSARAAAVVRGILNNLQ